MNSLKLTNSLTRKKEVFKPNNIKKISLYACGPTVYESPHVGNARTLVVFDVLFRVLKVLYNSNVTYVRNITDVDDKINNAAIENGESIKELTGRVTSWFWDDMEALNNLEPTHQPKATENIDNIISFIEKIINNGKGYVSEGHVLLRSLQDLT